MFDLAAIMNLHADDRGELAAFQEAGNKTVAISARELAGKELRNIIELGVRRHLDRLVFDGDVNNEVDIGLFDLRGSTQVSKRICGRVSDYHTLFSSTKLPAPVALTPPALIASDAEMFKAVVTSLSLSTKWLE
jgi:hypothetical protein